MGEDFDYLSNFLLVKIYADTELLKTMQYVNGWDKS